MVQFLTETCTEVGAALWTECGGLLPSPVYLFVGATMILTGLIRLIRVPGWKNKFTALLLLLVGAFLTILPFAFLESGAYAWYL